MKEEVYPEPHKEYSLKVDGHEVWYCETGNPKGIPVVSLHGGPGSMSKASHIGRFNLDKYRVVQIDQRGSGRSTPSGSIKNNTTQDLISDMEAIREKLKVDKWVVAGGSWGSTLSLLYAQAHPTRVRALSLTAIFLGRPKDVDWYVQETGAGAIYPEIIHQRAEFYKQHGITDENWSEVFYKKLTEGTDKEKRVFTAATANFEHSLMFFDTEYSFIRPDDVVQEMIDAAALFMHYESNGFFVSDNEILDNIDKIQDIPTAIVHGRYDILCPLSQAFKLHKALSNSIFEVSTNSSHKMHKDAYVLAAYMLETIL